MIWKNTWKGLTLDLYGKMWGRSERKGFGELSFSMQEFRVWFEDVGCLAYNTWVMSSWKKGMRPSVDRLDCLKGYSFDNMQVITAKENRTKGDAEKLVLWGKRVQQITLESSVVRTYDSVKEASRRTGINKNNISSCCNKNRNHAGGYKWSYV